MPQPLKKKKNQKPNSPQGECVALRGGWEPAVIAVTHGHLPVRDRRDSPLPDLIITRSGSPGVPCLLESKNLSKKMGAETSLSPLRLLPPNRVFFKAPPSRSTACAAAAKSERNRHLAVFPSHGLTQLSARGPDTAWWWVPELSVCVFTAQFGKT